MNRIPVSTERDISRATITRLFFTIASCTCAVRTVDSTNEYLCSLLNPDFWILGMSRITPTMAAATLGAPSGGISTGRLGVDTGGLVLLSVMFGSPDARCPAQHAPERGIRRSKKME